MNTVRAKFKVEEVRRSLTYKEVRKDEKGTPCYAYAEIQTVVMLPVYYGGSDPSHENAKFWQATPSGRLELGCVNLDAAKYFELGQEYYIDFSKADGNKE